jgi:hypothetical protein
MMTLDAVAALAAGLPEVTEGVRFGHRTWFVNGHAFAWERPFSKADLKRFGDTAPPAGPILAVTVADLHEKEAILATGSAGVFTIPHFNGFPAVLIALDRVTKTVLREAVVDGWLACASDALAEGYLASQSKRRRTDPGGRR